MVQFGDLLQSKSAEYTAIVPPESFLDYEKLKGIIKAKKQELKKKEGVEIDATDFFDAIDFEVKKIRDFIHNLSIGEDDLCSCTAGMAVSLRCVFVRKRQLTAEKISILQDYTALNREGFRKILKKWGKNFSATTSQREIEVRLANIYSVLEDPIQELDEMIAATQVVERSSNEKIALLIIMTGMIIASIVLGCTSKRIVAAFGIGVMFSFLLACGNGANDICNSVGTSVGCGAMTLKQAVVWGSIFEFLGAITMGQFVSKEISKGVLEATDYVGDDQDLFALCMVSVLVAAALTTLLATFYGFPISATHGIIGGLVSVGMAAKGTASIGWGVLGKMVIGWLLSPLLASTVSASLFLIINKAVLKTSDPFRAAQKWRPIFLWATLAVCAAFILIKGPKPIKNLWLSTGVWLAVVIAIIFGGVVTALYLGVKKATAKTDGKSAKGAEISFEKVESGLGEVVIAKESDSDGDGSDVERSNSRKDFVKKMSEKDEAEDEEDVERDDSEFQQETQEQKENKKKMEELFTPLLVISALCVAFAHGANDVGNAVGPLAVIFQVYDEGSIPANGKPNIPMWSLFMGACGFVFGIVFLGSKTIATVGTKITKLTPTRSYATQIGAAIAVLASSVVGLPVSTSHCLVGSVVGVGLAQKFLGEHNSLSLSVLKKIVLGWAVTIPLAMLVAVIVFLPFKGLFTE